MLLYHAINAAAFMHAADSRKRRAFTESGYAWVYASVCVLHTVLLAHPRLRCAPRVHLPCLAAGAARLPCSQARAGRWRPAGRMRAPLPAHPLLLRRTAGQAAAVQRHWPAAPCQADANTDTILVTTNRL